MARESDWTCDDEFPEWKGGDCWFGVESDCWMCVCVCEWEWTRWGLGSELFNVCFYLLIEWLICCRLDPAIKHEILDKNMTSLCFAETAHCLLIGDDTGGVSVYHIENLASYSRQDKDQSKALLEVVNGQKSTLIWEENIFFVILLMRLINRPIYGRIQSCNRQRTTNSSATIT